MLYENNSPMIIHFTHNISQKSFFATNKLIFLKYCTFYLELRRVMITFVRNFKIDN